MAGLVNKFVVGASVLVGMSAVVAAPAQASDMTFNGSDYATYTHDASNLWLLGTHEYYDEEKEQYVNALTDGDLTTNVELNYSSENDDKNVGFTSVAGDYTVEVSSVTDAEFETFQDQWVADLLDAYAPLKTVWNGLGSTLQDMAVSTFTSEIGSGDVNVAEFSLDETGAISMQTMGFFDLKPRVNMMVDGAVAQLNGLISMANIFGQDTILLDSKLDALNAFSGVLGQIEVLQISEMAKVTINGQSEYVYSFNATESGFTALDDGQSYSGVYSWNKPGQTASVPEPSTMLGLMAVGGLFAAAKRNSKKA